MKKRLNLFIYYFIVILFLEVCNKLFIFKHINIGLFFTILFSLLTASIIYFISLYIKNRKYKKIYTFLVTIIFILLFQANFIYYKLFSIPFSISTLSLATGAATFYKIAIEAIFKNIFYLLIFLVPLLLLILINKNIDYRYIRKRNKYLNICYPIVIYVLILIIIVPFKKSAYKYYYETDNLIESIDQFGFITAERLNIDRYINGFDEKIFIQEEKKEVINTFNEKSEIVYALNNTDINFNELYEQTNETNEKTLYEYFNSLNGTYKNEYTGYYKDKNLIFILAEGFNSIAVSQELTPTLYKLSHTGFVFNNYYSPVFLSTTGGEFQATTGLIPTQEILGLWRKNSPSFKYALGSSFKQMGYMANAYHDWTYSYYKRNKTMPTLGFDNYMGCHNGMEKLINCEWLPSDIDMMNNTVNNYVNEDKFVTYYISVSGHAPYNFNGGNSISSKNKELVENLPYSDSVKAYLATQIEFDRAIEALINNLKNNNKLDDTVIVITGDHYPYTLDLNEINEVSTFSRDETFTVNKSNLIIWNNNEDVIKEVNKVGSQIDVLPTILNLFGYDYDSRMIVGKDILSTSEGMAIFSNHSWISDSGKYDASNKVFTKNENIEVSQDYVDNMNARVDNSFAVSKKILETDIYKKVLGD